MDVLLYEETRDMLAANPDIHHIYGLDRRWKKQGKRYQLKMQWQLIQTLRQQRYDMVLNPGRPVAERGYQQTDRRRDADWF